MTDYVPCPACGGRGLLSLGEAEDIRETALWECQQEDAERVRADWAHRVAMVEADNRLRDRLRRLSDQQWREDAERRLADLENRARERGGT